MNSKSFLPKYLNPRNKSISYISMYHIDAAFRFKMYIFALSVLKIKNNL